MSTPDSTPRTSTALRDATGRDYAEWFAALDEWDTAGRAYREIADWLTAQGVSNWWAQKLIVEYEQARGLRQPGVRAGGTFTGGASKTIAVPVERLFAAFTDPSVRDRWLPDLTLSERSSRPGRSVRFDVSDGARLSVTFDAKGDTKAGVAVEQERLPDTEAADHAKAAWRERLTVLKHLLED